MKVRYIENYITVRYYSHTCGEFFFFFNLDLQVSDNRVNYKVLEVVTVAWEKLNVV